MSDISELESRISAAMDRIGRGLETLNTGGDDSASQAEIEQLKTLLDEEKTVSAQLEERIRGLKEKFDAEITALKQADTARETATVELDQRCQRVKRTNQALRENIANLREANRQNLGDAHLINKSMQIELDALRAARAVEKAEIDAIMATLKPLVSENSEDTPQAEQTMGDA